MRNTIFEILNDSVTRYPSLTAIRYAKKREIIDHSYQQLMDDVEGIMYQLFEKNLLNTHIAILGSSSYEWIVTYLAVVLSGSVAVPLDAGLPDDDLMELLVRGDVKGFFHDDAHKPLADRWISLGNKTAVALHDIPQLTAQTDRSEDFRSTVTRLEQSVDPDSICTIMFTSGTTGKSKGVMLSQRNLANNVDSVAINVDPGTIMLSVLPIHHAFCLTMDYLKGLSLGAVLCINDSLMHMMKNISRFQPHAILMVPLMIETIAKRLKEIDPSLPKDAVAKKLFGENLTMIFAGGARLDPSYIELFRDYNINIYQGYGMTECAPCISSNSPEQNRPGSVGRPLPNCEVRIVNEEIQVRGSSVMAGYYQMPQETHEALHGDWLLTGDLGHIDEDGYLYITGRKKNLIILSNGENISPEELEGQLSLHDLIAEIVITGNGNYLTAHIFPDPAVVLAQNLSDDNVKQMLQAILDDYNASQPTYRRIIGLDIRAQEFEKSSTRKIKRNLVH